MHKQVLVQRLRVQQIPREVIEPIEPSRRWIIEPGTEVLLVDIGVIIINAAAVAASGNDGWGWLIFNFYSPYNG